MMTDKRLVVMQVVILSSLVVLGNSLTFESSRPSLSSPDVIQVEDFEAVTFNGSKNPRLQPKETKPAVGDYVLKNQQGQVCLRASLGVVFTVMENKKKLFFNIDPKLISPTGYCGDQRAVLSLVFDGGNLEFTFIKEGRVSFVKRLRATLEPAPYCKNCKTKVYPGIADHDKLFSAAIGKSFKCKSKTSLIMSEDLRIKIIPLQIQAFDLPNGAFGKDVECWADYNQRIVPIVLGAVAVGILLIGVLVYVLLRERRRQGYEEL